jgi:exodeoxyribonuclease VII large subunit
MPIGLGAQQRAREELRSTLEREGLFDIRHKRPIPKYPSKVAVVTSATGAAIKDILEVSSKRAPFIDIVLIPAAVQGAEAPMQVTRALALAGRMPCAECVILARGGGAKDDLSTFDDELIVRAIRSCPLPVVTGVGHQIDNSLADLAADIAMPTPSAAAEKVFPDMTSITFLLSSSGDYIRAASARLIDRYAANLDRSEERIFRDVNVIASEKTNFVRLASREIKRYIEASTERNEFFLAKAAATLHALSPLAVLGRGFSICRDTEGNSINASSRIKIGDHVSIQFHAGSAEAEISSTKE